MSEHLQQAFYREISDHLRARTAATSGCDWELLTCRFVSAMLLLLTILLCHFALAATPTLTAWLSVQEVL